MTTEERIPKAGDPFLLDGFLYRLTGAQKQLGSGDQVIVLQLFERPQPADEAEAKRHRANFNYKRDGKCVQSELIWLEPHDILEEIRTQAAQLARGNARVKAWADGACRAQEAAVKGVGACWTLPGRHLLKPPVKVIDGSEVIVLPTDAKGAEVTAVGLLDGSFYNPAEG